MWEREFDLLTNNAELQGPTFESRVNLAFRWNFGFVLLRILYWIARIKRRKQEAKSVEFGRKEEIASDCGLPSRYCDGNGPTMVCVFYLIFVIVVVRWYKQIIFLEEIGHIFADCRANK